MQVLHANKRKVQQKMQEEAKQGMLSNALVVKLWSESLKRFQRFNLLPSPFPSKQVM